MALEIIETCVNCHACLPVCPSRAIVEARPHFQIVREDCTECLGSFAVPQCASICPVEGAIVNEENEPLNPPGSLTGIAPERWAEAQRAIAQRGRAGA